MLSVMDGIDPFFLSMKLKYDKEGEEFQIDVAPEETFGLNDKRLKCIVRTKGQTCRDCFFDKGYNCSQILCSKLDRQDKRDVLFVIDNTKRVNARNEQNQVVVKAQKFRFY